jgi:hypothetical protein
MKAQPCLLVHQARLVAILGIGRDHGDDRDRTRIRAGGGHRGNAANVLAAILAGESEVAREAGAQGIAVKHAGPPAGRE